MKKFNVSLLLLLFVHQLSAFNFYDQLCNFNFNWKKYALRAPVGETRHFNSDKEYIQAHLTCVLSILRSNPVDQLNAQQYNSRMHLIEVLDGYRVAGNFPQNYYHHGRVPVFIDENKTHCAVGFLMQQTGHEDMALRIAAADNYAWVKDIHDPELPSWQEASGFTVEELKLIQGAYDSYIDNAFILPNKYEIPQKPSCMVVYFENEALHKPMSAKPENVWCKGEGANGILNGRWEQNYAVGIPWIVGYYENGQRSGQWQEYYQGTKQLCRTENWRNNKLNGIRKRFDRFGNLIEEILFKDGKAMKKTNYSLEDSLTWVRRPIDSVLVWTEVYNFEGAMIAMGQERIHNPGNLLWFQNIELTALNTISIQARDQQTSSYPIYGGGQIVSPRYGRGWSYTPPLVTYTKEGDWVYYEEYNYTKRKTNPTMKTMLVESFKHFGQALVNSVSIFEDMNVNNRYDSVKVEYVNDNLTHFYGYGSTDFVHLYICYYDEKVAPRIDLSYYGYNAYSEQNSHPPIKECGQYNRANEKIGVWKHYSTGQKLYKTENFLVAWKEEEEDQK